MHRIIAKDVVVEFPIYGAKGRSLKSAFIHAATGGRLSTDAADRVVVRALDNVSFEFRDGDRVGLVGHNGSGKSTLLRLITGAYEPVSGFIEVTGKVASMLSVTLGMDPEATGYENILLRGAIMGLKPDEIASLANEICDFAELGDFIEMPLRTYSSGMSMRLAFAISTSVQADIILMDEWLSAGDTGFTAKAQQRLHDLLDQAKILVLASHSPETIRRNCSKIVHLEHGCIVSETTGSFVSRRKEATSPESPGTVSPEQRAAPISQMEMDRSIPLSERLEVWTSRGDPSYDENNLVTWTQSIDFLIDPRFLAAYKRGMDSGHQIMRPPGSRDDIQIKWRVAINCWAGRHAARLPGDFVECGTNTGIFSLAVCEYINFNDIGKSFWLFDTFCGIPQEQISEEERVQGRADDNALLYPPCFEVARRNFAFFPRARLIEGAVPDTLKTAPIEQVSYLSLDMSIAFPERAAIEHFWPRLVPGGIVVIAAYGWAPYRSIKRSMDEFASTQGAEIMMLPTGQGLLIKA
jgi:ABC-type polysaccharide/polyol phosphate transport system ATPase subunit